MEDWRNLAKEYRPVLIRIGYTTKQVDGFRLSISDPIYWNLKQSISSGSQNGGKTRLRSN
jgi:hypothetical protein